MTDWDRVQEEHEYLSLDGAEVLAEELDSDGLAQCSGGGVRFVQYLFLQKRLFSQPSNLSCPNTDVCLFSIESLAIVPNQTRIR